jgi:arginase
MRVQLIQVPYDSGHRDTRMGRGPGHLIRHGAAEELRLAGHEVGLETIEAAGAFHTEGQAAFDLCRTLAGRVREAAERDAIPLVLSGNCNTALGALAGLGMQGLGLIWFDAHGDFNTPETTESGYLDGMGLAVATGRCWSRIAAKIPGFHPLPDSHVLHVGGRDFDAGEEALLARSEVAVLPARQIGAASLLEVLGPGLEALQGRVQRLYVHVDLDVLDPQQAPANEYGAQVPGGLSVDQAEEAIQAIGERFRICGAGLAAYDSEGRTLAAGIRILMSLLAHG